MFWKIISLVLVSIMMVGCGTAASTPTPTNTPEPTPTEPAPEETAPKSNGEILFNAFQPKVGFACATCHYTNIDLRLIGPSLLTVASRFETYVVEAEDLRSYLHQSILEPHAFIVPESPAYPDNVMPDKYSQVFSEDEINDLVDYILSLGQAS